MTETDAASRVGRDSNQVEETRVRARVYADLRTAQLERAPGMVPATLLYGSTRYDFQPQYAEGLDVIHVPSVLHMARHLLRSDVRVLEVNEPGMPHGVERAAVAIACCRLAALVRRTSVDVVTYAIGNTDPFDYRTTRVTGQIRKVVRRGLSRWVCGQLDRIVFGTSAAQDMYLGLWGRLLRSAESRMILEIPSPCTCPPAERDLDLVIFVGALTSRKAVTELLDAWPEVTAARPSARLLIIGKGDLVDVVVEAADNDPTITVSIDPPRADIHYWLRRASVLVLLSKVEQVGLPLVEGLAHGCRVVSSNATGLAPWLAGHGHHVVPVGTPAPETAVAIMGAIDRRDAGFAVTKDLPGKAGRTAADEWLMA